MEVLFARATIANNSTIDVQSLQSFGPAEATGFDFTPLFENTILSIVPSAILLLAFPYRIFDLQGKRPKVARGGVLHDSKLIFLMVFAATNLAFLVLQALGPSRSTPAIIAATLELVCSLGLVVLSHFEHIRSLRPSPLINAYLLLTLVFDIARVRTLFLNGVSGPLAACFSSMMGVKIMVLLAEAIEKRSILLEPYRYLSPEETSGLYSKSFFFWLNQLLTTGSSRLLRNKDLYPIDRDMKSEVLREKMELAWSAASKGKPNALFGAILRANFKALMYGVIPRFVQIAFRYTQPFLLTRTIAFANDLSQPDNVGWGLTGAFFVVLLGLAVSNGLYYHMAYRFVVSVRGSLVSIIYSKTVDLSIMALDESVAVTLMSNDTQAICFGFETIHDFWAVPLELGIALYLLARQLGIACVAPAILAILSGIGILIVAKPMGQAQKTWMQSIQTRVNGTAAMLGSMKSVKLLGFTDWLSEIIQGLRVRELVMAGLFRKLLLVRVFLANTMTTVAPFVTLAVFTLLEKFNGRALDASSAYTVLTLISLIASPVNDLIRAVPAMNAAMASLTRIQSFLESDARRDPRIFLSQALSLSDSRSFPDQVGIDLNDQPEPDSPGYTQVVTAQNLSFSWIESEKPVVNNISFGVSSGEFCFIIGPVGCGKSTLLKGVLGETLSTKGFLYTKYRETAFVDQTPWISNTSLRDNIIGISPYEEEWYKEVVKACALDQDVILLPNGHCESIYPS
jgi:ABC-type multidrug transport system fused ATPase/permease subunit